ncbi:11410_t:CDS:1, partial [Ambispora leptoticha]
GKDGRKFARSYLNIRLNRRRSQVPSLKELCYSTILKSDIEQSNSNDFGLLQAIENLSFLQELSDFANSDNLPIHNFPLLYEFVKCRIYYIVIHQQQVEGLFNNYDLKCHKNMNMETKKAKLCLSSAKQISLSDEDLAVQRR